MRRLVQAHPEDADATALYAEAIMDLHPWNLWSNAGKPGPDTLELVDRRVGDWADAIEANEHSSHHVLDYRVADDPDVQATCGHYEAFITYAYTMVGNELRARKSAEECKNSSGDRTREMSVLLRFHVWEDVLVLPGPAPDLNTFGRSLHAVAAFWHFGRGLAFTAQGRLDRAQNELEALQAEQALLPLSPGPLKPDGALGLEHWPARVGKVADRDSTAMAADILRARLAEARGQLAEATELLHDAVRIQDAIPYGEPPIWFYPVRESLGAAQLKRGDTAGAANTFHEGLRSSPHNPRLLLGLSEAESAMGNAGAAQAARREFRQLWQGAEGEPKVADF
jgi:tetratricopeptide (TPR) repeat protein